MTMLPHTPSYINGMGIIAPQKTWDESFLNEISHSDNNVLKCVTPDFKSYIPPAQLRRLSRMLRIGLTSATLCLRNSNLQHPDGIITATGYGFLEETEKFLREMLERNEQQLTPTFFVQGTYNALSGLIGLATQCQGYNNTYVSRGFAFESALQDAMLHLAEKKSATFLIGSYDEAVDVLYAIGRRSQYYKVEPVHNLQLFDTVTNGTIQGEGSAFFSISGTARDTTWCAIQGLKMIYLPSGGNTLEEALTSFLKDHARTPADVDIFISGASGDFSGDHRIRHLGDSLLKNTTQVRFKHLCGEYCTAVSFALWLGAKMLRQQTIPEIVQVTKPKAAQKIETILIVNHFLDRNYSLILLTRHA